MSETVYVEIIYSSHTHEMSIILFSMIIFQI